MTTKIEIYRDLMRGATDIGAFLKKNSGLPGPRGNLELAHAFAQTASSADIWRFARLEPQAAPENTPAGFVAFCGVLGLGRLIAEGDPKAEALLRTRASDPRWRVREAVATALQLVGDRDRRRFHKLAADLARGNPLEQRAAVAGVAEPRLLDSEAESRAGLRLLDAVTRSLSKAAKPLTEPDKVLRQALAYAWSVVVASHPRIGQPAMERWMSTEDPDLLWLLEQNLRKNRLQRAAPGWTSKSLRHLAKARKPSRPRPAPRRR